jgi:hypothetical protein
VSEAGHRKANSTCCYSHIETVLIFFIDDSKIELPRLESVDGVGHRQRFVIKYKCSWGYLCHKRVNIINNNLVCIAKQQDKEHFECCQCK